MEESISPPVLMKQFLLCKQILIQFMFKIIVLLHFRLSGGTTDQNTSELAKVGIVCICFDSVNLVCCCH